MPDRNSSGSGANDAEKVEIQLEKRSFGNLQNESEHQALDSPPMHNECLDTVLRLQEDPN